MKTSDLMRWFREDNDISNAKLAKFLKELPTTEKEVQYLFKSFRDLCELEKYIKNYIVDSEGRELDIENFTCKQLQNLIMIRLIVLCGEPEENDGK